MLTVLDRSITHLRNIYRSLALCPGLCLRLGLCLSLSLGLGLGRKSIV